MAVSWLINGGDPITTYKSWDDPPSTPLNPRIQSSQIEGFLG